MEPFDFSRHTSLTRDKLGIWRSANVTDLSYPEDGNAGCFALEADSFWFTHRNDCISALVRRFPPNGAILDIGGGNGFVSKRLLDDGHTAVVLEPGPVGARNAKTRRGLPHVICATLEDIGPSRGIFAAAGMFDVLEHIADDHALLTRTHNLLPSGGLVYITVPAFTCLWSGSDTTAGHYRRYTLKSLTALLSLKFDILYCSYMFQALLPPVLLLRALPYRLMGKKRGGLLPAAREHGAKGSTRLIRFFLRRELRRIAGGGAMRWGTSLLAAARAR